MTRWERLKYLKETNIEEYKKLKIQINTEQRIRRKKVKEENPQLYEKRLKKARERGNEYTKKRKQDPIKYTKYLNYQKLYAKGEIIVDAENKYINLDKPVSYEKMFDSDVPEYFIKQLVKKTRTHLVVNESKKIVGRALNAYNY